MKNDEPNGRKTSSMSRHQKILIGIAISFLLYSIAGFVILPGVLKNTLEKKLTENLKRQVSVEAVQINPYLLQVTINKFVVSDLSNDDLFIAFDRLFVDLEIFSVFKRALVVREMTLSSPRVHLARFKDLTYNFSDITGPAAEKEKTTAPLLFSVNNIKITDGSITFFDEPKETTHTVTDLNLAVPFLSTVQHEVEINVEPAFSAIINNTPVKLYGRTVPFHESRKTLFDMYVSDLDLLEYLAYFPRIDSLKLKSGYMDAVAVLGFELQPGNKPDVTLAGNFSLKNIDIVSGRDESYITLPRLDIKLSDSRPLAKDFHLASVSLNEPGFLIRRSNEGDILPFKLLGDSAANTDRSEPRDKGAAVKLKVDEISLNNGTIRFDDQGITERFQTTLNPVDIRINGLSTLENEKASCDISMKTDAEETIAINGTLSLNPVAVRLQTSLQNLKLPRFSPYYSEYITPTIADGRLNVSADVDFTGTGKEQTAKAENISVRLDSLSADDKDNKKLLMIAAISASGSSLDLAGKQLVVGDFSANEGELQIVRQKDGVINLEGLLRTRKTDKEKTDTAGTDASSPWIVTLRNGTVSDFRIVLQDNALTEPATILIDTINLSAENISTIEKSRGTVDLGLRIDNKGTLSVKGPVAIEPLAATLDVGLTDLQVKTLQPYFADRVNLVIGDGAVALDGQLEVSKNSSKKIAILFSGNSSIGGFSSFDPVAGEDFLKWKDLRLKGMVYDSSRSSFRVEEIGLHEFYNKITVFENVGMNLKAILKEPAGPEKTEITAAEIPEKETEKGNPLLIEIDTLKLDMGQIAFLDRNITPNYASSFSELTGTVTGLSSRSDVMAEVNVSGKLDQHAPLRITGKVNPLREELFADLIFDFRDIELSPTSPYTGKFIGYTVAKGKLTLDLKYLVEGSRIDGSNKAFLNQFTLGEAVDSPDNLNLPVQLAISLLSNRKGEITLNVPVSGDLNDPKFSIGGIVFRAIIKLIAKAATSPFALLGALIPEGAGDLQYVDFAPGSSVIEDAYARNLETVAKVLYDRPGLKMDIKGSVNAEEERQALHEKQFQQLLKNEKYKEISRKKDESVSLDDIVIEPDEYNDLLKEAYREATFEKPKNALGFTKRLPPEEMEQLLRENITITDDDLRLLAIERANRVKSFLVETGSIEPERLFIIEPKMSETGTGSPRVEMIIK